TAQLYEHATLSLHRAAGPNRLLACGAAMTNIRLAVRTAGWLAETRFVSDPDRPDRVAEVSAGEILPPTLAEAHRFAAIFGRTASPASGGPPSSTSVRAVAAASWCAGVELRRLDAELTAAVLAITGQPAVPGTETLLALTVDDGRLDRVRAGAAVQAACLTGCAVGVRVRPVAEPLWVPGVRASLIERLSLAGYPQVLLRVEALISHN
ncbi:MAG TPA: hypothetical protein VF892_06915, partial [Pseudonocardiaceae bacterium]